MGKFAYPLVILSGLVLMVGGIATGTHGAVVIGIIVSGVAASQWLRSTR